MASTTKAKTKSADRLLAAVCADLDDDTARLAYADFLGVMDISQAKTRFFKRDSTKADKLTLHPHKEREFWLWVASWALFIQKPSDLGFSDEGYALPPMDVRWHEVPTDHSSAGFDKWNQAKMFRDAAISLQDAASEKRNSLPQRLAALQEIRAEDPDAPRRRIRPDRRRGGPEGPLPCRQGHRGRKGAGHPRLERPRRLPLPVRGARSVEGRKRGHPRGTCRRTPCAGAGRSARLRLPRVRLARDGRGPACACPRPRPGTST